MTCKTYLFIPLVRPVVRKVSAMPLNRFLNLPKEEQDRVYEVAKIQFASHGYDAMSLNLLLKELEISKGQFYYWFEDKADLFLSILDQGITSLVAILEGHGSPSNPEDYWPHLRSARLLVEAYWNDQEYVEIGTMIGEQMADNHPIFGRLKASAEPIKNYWQEQIILGQNWGLVRSDLSAATLVELLDAVGDQFYKIMLNLLNNSPAKGVEAGVLHELLGTTLRSLIETPNHRKESDSENTA